MTPFLNAGSTRRLLALVLCVSVPLTSGCNIFTTRIVPGDFDPDPHDLIRGLTTVDGDVVDFDGEGMIRDAQVHGQVDGQPYVIGLADVAHLLVTREAEGIDSGVAGATIAVAIAIALVVAVAVLIAVLIAAKGFCPFVYSWDGSRFVFDAELYAGAITRGLEKDDYSELEHLEAVDGVYRLMVRNEVPESQFTNLMELWVVDHPPATRVVADYRGRLSVVSSAKPPITAMDGSGRDLLLWLQATDRRVWEPRTGEDSPPRREIVMTFPRPAGATEATLVVNVGTSQWGSHMMRKLVELRGREVTKWYARMDSNPSAREAYEAWILREGLYALEVQVEEATGWETRAVLEVGGPFAVEDRALRMDISKAIGDSLRVRVQPPAGFWAFNSFAVSYDPRDAASTQVKVLEPFSAVDETTGDVRSALLATDEEYHAMPRTGDMAVIEFRAPQAVEGMERTILLHSRGYYRLHLSPDREPDRATLRTILSEPDGAARLAARLLSEFRDQKLSRTGDPQCPTLTGAVPCR